VNCRFTAVAISSRDGFFHRIHQHDELADGVVPA